MHQYTQRMEYAPAFLHMLMRMHMMCFGVLRERTLCDSVPHNMKYCCNFLQYVCSLGLVLHVTPT